MRMKFALLALVSLVLSSSFPGARLSGFPNPPSPQVRVSGKLMAAKLRRRVQPAYPKEAKTKGIEGTVRLHATIARDGSVAQIEVISGPEELVQGTLDAVRQWQYEPTIWKGSPVDVDTTIDVVFVLSRK